MINCEEVEKNQMLAETCLKEMTSSRDEWKKRSIYLTAFSISNII